MQCVVLSCVHGSVPCSVWSCRVCTVVCRAVCGPAVHDVVTKYNSSVVMSIELSDVKKCYLISYTFHLPILAVRMTEFCFIIGANATFKAPNVVVWYY